MRVYRVHAVEGRTAVELVTTPYATGVTLTKEAMAVFGVEARVVRPLDVESGPSIVPPAPEVAGIHNCFRVP